MLERKLCGNCAFWKQGGSICPFYKTSMPEDEHCPMFAKTINECSICGQVTLKLPILQYDGNEVLQYCETCAEYLGACPTCTLGLQCAFEQDTSVKIPPYIMQTIRQGNMTIQQQSKNPDRIEATCKKCPCFNSSENYCFKEFNCCDNWHQKKAQKGK